MTKKINELLAQINFSPKEKEVYLATLELGEAPVSPIAQRALINRATTYHILNSLIDKGLVAKVDKAKKLHYSALGLEGLETYLNAQRDELEKSLKVLREGWPEFSALIGSANTKPSVRLFEGKMGLREVFKDQIQGDHKEILTYSIGSKIEPTFGEFIKTYTKQKSRTKMLTKLIAPEEPELHEYLKKSYGEKLPKLFKVKTVPLEKFPMESEINIYGNKLALISLGEKELAAVIIESPSLARSQRLIFELLWDKL